MLCVILIKCHLRAPRKKAKSTSFQANLGPEQAFDKGNARQIYQGCQACRSVCVCVKFLVKFDLEFDLKFKISDGKIG